MTFVFTHHNTPTSNAVRDTWYSATTEQVAVKLKGSNAIYVYSDVPKDAYSRFLDGPSVGRNFADLKKTYGPGERLYESPVSVGAQPVSVVQPASKVARQEVAPRRLSLASAPAPAIATSRFTIRFESNERVREYTSDFVSSSAALSALDDIGNMLGLSFVVNSIEQFFDR